MSKEECAYISDSLVYFLNSLRIPEQSANLENEAVADRTDKIHPSRNSNNFDSHSKYCFLWNLFTLGFDRLLIDLLVHAEKV